MSALTKTELDEFQTQLNIWQARLRGDVRDLTQGAFEGNAGESRSPNHPAELGSENFEQDFTLDLIHNEQEVLDDVSFAISKLQKGSFGICERCVAEGKPEKKSFIPKARLKAIPWAKNCVDCEREREKENQ